MAQIVQQGQINTAALTVADVYVQIVPPQFLINGLATNVIGVVGTASWGPVGAAAIVGGYTDYSTQFGPMVPRTYDMGTPIFCAGLQGNVPVYRCVRVTDGSDTAATVSLGTNGMTLTSLYTGSLGNLQAVTVNHGSAAGSVMVTLSIPGVVPENHNNITQGLQAFTVVPGTGYTSVPAITVSAPNMANGVQATATASLIVVSQTLGSAGTGHAVNDVLTLSNGVQVKVTTVGSNGTITAVSIVNAGSLVSGSIPTNPVAMTATTGIGIGATFNLVWGFGPVSITTPGSGYTSVTATVTGGGAGTGGTYTPGIAYWTNIVSAINLGQSGIRGPSRLAVATKGTGTGTPTYATSYSFTGGTDGAAGVNSSYMVGQDALPRTGMYALRGSGSSIGMLTDVADSTTYSTQIAYGLSEGTYMIATTPVGDTITNASTTKSTAGIDSYALKLMLGDWVYFNDTVNNQQRLASPQGFVVGILGNLAPNQSSLNKPMQGIVGTQKSATKVPYAIADLQALAVAGIDVICNPIPVGASFGCRNGRNTSSNAVINGDNYTRMTNFIAATLAAAMGIYVGTLQSQEQRLEAKATIDYFFQNLFDQGLIGNADGTIPWNTTLDGSNNSDQQVALGYEQASVQVQYLSVVQFLILNVQGGQSVTLTTTTESALNTTA